MPISGSTTSSVLPPAFFMASANSRHCLRRGAQRGARSAIVAEQHQDGQLQVGREIAGGGGTTRRARSTRLPRCLGC